MSEEEQLKRIADSLEKVVKVYEDPQAYLEQVSRGVTAMLSGTQVSLPSPVPAQAVPGGTVPPVGPAVTEVVVTVKLSDEERKAICDQAMADIEEQMTEFKGLIGQALSELPEHQLKRIGDLIAKGEKFKLRRRHGCIYLDFGQGDDDFWLRM